MSDNFTDTNKYKSLTGNTSSNRGKTTDINILLNRVRLDKKKIFKKNLYVSFLLVSLVCTISFFFII